MLFSSAIGLLWLLDRAMAVWRSITSIEFGDGVRRIEATMRDIHRQNAPATDQPQRVTWYHAMCHALLGEVYTQMLVGERPGARVLLANAGFLLRNVPRLAGLAPPDMAVAILEPQKNPFAPGTDGNAIQIGPDNLFKSMSWSRTFI